MHFVSKWKLTKLKLSRNGCYVDLDYLVSDEEEAMWGELVSILI
jgi:hypothetical protein